jgi:hypothetical protein
MVAFLNQIHPERFDERALANPGNAGNSESKGISGIWEELVDNLFGQALVIRPGTLDQRDGFG